MKTILVLSPKGGSGKSTTARNLSAIAAADGFRVGALDVDEQGTFSHWLTVRAKQPDLPRIEGVWTQIAGGAAELRKMSADLVVVDTPTAVEMHPAEVKQLVLAADLIVVPTQPTEDDVRSVKEFMKRLMALKRPSAFLVNRLRPRVKEAEGARRELARVGHVLGAGIPDSVEIQRALSHGYGVVESRGKGCEEFRSVWDEIRRLVSL